MVAHQVHTLKTWFDSNVRNQVATKYAIPKTNKTFSGEDARTQKWSYTRIYSFNYHPL